MKENGLMTSEPDLDPLDTAPASPDPIVRWQPAHRAVGGRVSLGAATAGASAFAIAAGMVAVGALAIGAVAIGALAIGRLNIGKVRLRDVEIDRLTVRELVGLK